MKSCPTCRSVGTMTKISRKKWSSQNLDEAVYYDKYFCCSITCKCMTLYMYCKICREFAPHSFVDMVRHERNKHPRFGVEQAMNAPFIIERDVGGTIPRIMRRLCSNYPQFPTIIATQKQIIRLDEDDNMLGEIISNLPFREYECRLCSREYDAFPTEKQVSRHFKTCPVAIEIRKSNTCL